VHSLAKEEQTMKKHISWYCRIGILVGMVFLVFTSLLLAEPYKETIRITTGESAPYFSEKLDHNGFVCHILTEAFKLEGVRVNLEFSPWNRAMILAKTGKRDGTFGWFLTAERDKFFFFSDPVAYNYNVFFHLKSFDFDWHTIRDLKGITSGIVLGYTYGEEFDAAVEKRIIPVFSAYSDTSNFKNLLASRIKIFPVDPNIGNYILQHYFSQKQRDVITFHPRPLNAPLGMYLLLPKQFDKSRRLLSLFNRGLKRLKQSGRYDQIGKEFKQGKYNIKK